MNNKGYVENQVIFSAQFKTEKNALSFVNAIKDNFTATINKNLVTIGVPISVVTAYDLSKKANRYNAVRIQF